MKSILFPGAALFFLIACNSGTKNNKKDNANASDTSVIPAVQKIEPEKLDTASVPATIDFKGRVQEAWRWTDKMGDNLLLTTSIAPFNDKRVNEFGETGQTATLYAYHYVKTGTEPYKLLWGMEDSEMSCPFDITNEFIRDAITITDLDADLVAETKIQYKQACRSDVSPAVMKLVMHEGNIKFGLQGLMWLKAGDDDKFTVTEADANLEKLPGYKKEDNDYYKTFGRYESEKEFADVPVEFLSHARYHWMKFVKESFE